MSLARNIVRGLYILIPVIILVLLFNLWGTANVLTARGFGFFISYTFISITLILFSMILHYKVNLEDLKKSAIVYFLLIMNIVIMIYYAGSIIGDPIKINQLSFYYIMSMVSCIILIASHIGNLLGIEKGEQGFNIWIHSKDSVIGPKIGLLLYIGIFFAMGAFVFSTGNTIISYPIFGTIGNIGASALSSFGVGDWENISLIVFPFALIMSLITFAKGRKRLENVSYWLMTLIAMFTSIMTFTIYHYLVYQTIISAMIYVMFSGLLMIVIYRLTKSLIIISAVHIGNNFWGALFAKVVFGLAVVQSQVIQASMNSIACILALISSIAFILLFRQLIREGKIPIERYI